MTSENIKIGMTGLTSGQSRVGAAEGCDLLILFLIFIGLSNAKVKRSQPSAAPTGGMSCRGNIVGEKKPAITGRFFCTAV
jgi:hypothetical protein